MRVPFREDLRAAQETAMRARIAERIAGAEVLEVLVEVLVQVLVEVLEVLVEVLVQVLVQVLVEVTLQGASTNWFLVVYSEITHALSGKQLLSNSGCALLSWRPRLRWPSRLLPLPPLLIAVTLAVYNSCCIQLARHGYMCLSTPSHL